MRTTAPFRAPLAALAAALSAALLAPPVAATNYGRVLVLNETVNGTVDPEADGDDFVFDAATGWKVTVKVKKAKGAALAPVLTLIAPDGSVETAGVKAKAGKSSASLSATLLEGGRFAVRVTGASGTGGYALSWKLKFKGGGAATVKAVEDPDGGDAGFDPENDQWTSRTYNSETTKDWPLP